MITISNEPDDLRTGNLLGTLEEDLPDYQLSITDRNYFSAMGMIVTIGKNDF